VAQKFHFSILRIEVTRASRGLSAIAELLVNFSFSLSAFPWANHNLTQRIAVISGSHNKPTLHSQTHTHTHTRTHTHTHTHLG